MTFVIHRRRLFVLVVGFLLAVPSGCNSSTSSDSGVPTTSSDTESVDPITSARVMIRRQDFSGASKLLQAVLVTEPSNPAALELMGDLAALNGEVSHAITSYQLAIDATAEPSIELMDKLGQQFVNAGRPFDALDTLNRIVAEYPDEPAVRQKLIGLQSALGMQSESIVHLQWMVQRGHGDVNLLTILSDLIRPQTVESMCEYALEHYHEDLRPQFSLVCLAAYHGKWSEVAKQLHPVIVKHPEFLPAQALYGRSLVELNRTQEVKRWAESLPDGIDQYRDYWLAAGTWAERGDDAERAAYAFHRAVLLNENDGEALNRLSASLAELDRDRESQIAAERAAKISLVREGVDSLLKWNKNSQTAAVLTAESLDQLGRRWEATAWLQAAFRMNQNPDPRLQETYQSIRQNLTGRTPWQIKGYLVTDKIDLAELPGVDWRRRRRTDVTPREASASLRSELRFTDQASLRGLDYISKINKPVGEASGLWVYQSGAGGAGVIDYDLDGWPDLYLTSMDGQPGATDSSPNGLFRNVGGQFVETTRQAAVGDQGFGQGIAVGDINADGLPDLLVANIGRNRLFRNNGDGTFSDVTKEAGISGLQWTTSVAIADINGDSHADLFEAGYCAGERPYREDCIDQELGERRTCAPLAFDPQPDRIWRGLGDGRLSNATKDWMGEHSAGRGLGLVVGELDQHPGLDILVANDMTANHFWSRNQIVEDAFRLSEQASFRGLAFNQNGVSQASMGIAAGDADGDLDVDFLVTHFVQEYNTFYEQRSPGTWADRSNRVDLAKPSDSMLGYGTQWIDGDNNGSPELIVANGDIDDFSHKDRKFRQRPQLFQRGRDGRWGLIEADKLGDYFVAEHLGRSLVTLDADRDGRTDVAITHLNGPVALLINESGSAGDSITLSLKATKSHPDAIGAKVTIEADGRPMLRQQMAGDGYQCSNERCLHFGLGEAKEATNVSVEWPSGDRETFGTIPANKQCLLVEGSGEPFHFE